MYEPVTTFALDSLPPPHPQMKSLRARIKWYDFDIIFHENMDVDVYIWNVSRHWHDIL